MSSIGISVEEENDGSVLKSRSTFNDVLIEISGSDIFAAQTIKGFTIVAVARSNPNER